MIVRDGNAVHVNANVVSKNCLEASYCCGIMHVSCGFRDAFQDALMEANSESRTVSLRSVVASRDYCYVH